MNIISLPIPIDNKLNADFVEKIKNMNTPKETKEDKHGWCPVCDNWVLLNSVSSPKPQEIEPLKPADLWFEKDRVVLEKFNELISVVNKHEELLTSLNRKK